MSTSNQNIATPEGSVQARRLSLQRCDLNPNQQWELAYDGTIGDIQNSRWYFADVGVQPGDPDAYVWVIRSSGYAVNYWDYPFLNEDLYGVATVDVTGSPATFGAGDIAFKVSGLTTPTFTAILVTSEDDEDGIALINNAQPDFANPSDAESIVHAVGDGVFVADFAGEFDGTATLPAGVAPGDYLIKVQALTGRDDSAAIPLASDGLSTAITENTQIFHNSGSGAYQPTIANYSFINRSKTVIGFAPLSIEPQTANTITLTVPANGVSAPNDIRIALANDDLQHASDMIVTNTQPGECDNGGTLAPNPDHNANWLIFTPSGEFSGIETCQYTFEDQNGNPYAGEIVVTVTPTVSQSVETMVDTPVAVQLVNPKHGAVKGSAPFSLVSCDETSVEGGTVVIDPQSANPARPVYTPPAGFDGTDTFTCIVADANGVESAPGTITVTVTPQTVPFVPDVPVTGVTLSDTEVTLTVGDTHTLAAAIEPEDATNQGVTMTSSDETVAWIDEDGVIHAVGVGTATITVTTVDGDFSATCLVTVNAPAGPEQPTPPKNPPTDTDVPAGGQVTGNPLPWAACLMGIGLATIVARRRLAITS